MYHSMGGWNWLWMSFAAVAWILVLGAIVYFAVRLAHRDGTR